jgi:hypothetical protein
MFKINSIDELNTITKRMKWQYFEKLVAFIFEKNDFSVRQNVVMKFPEGKRQFDVIAERFDKIFLVECKKWSGRHGISAIIKAVEEHMERCRLFSKKEKKSAIPILVTLFKEEINLQENVPIVPIDKLNLFLNSENRELSN